MTPVQLDKLFYTKCFCYKHIIYFTNVSSPLDSCLNSCIHTQCPAAFSLTLLWCCSVRYRTFSITHISPPTRRFCSAHTMKHSTISQGRQHRSNLTGLERFLQDLIGLYSSEQQSFGMGFKKKRHR